METFIHRLIFLSVTTALGPMLVLAGSNFDEPYTIISYAGRVSDRDASGSAARFSAPRGLACDGEGNLYVADHLNHKIRRVTPTGEVTTFAGTGNSGSSDGAAGVATFKFPTGIAVDSMGNAYVADTGNLKIRKITPSGTVVT